MISKAAAHRTLQCMLYLPFCPSLSMLLCTECCLSISLTEEEGRDLSCIIASLVQVMLDPYFRTITGFQSLIQKEWVMAGYPFLDRCNHLKRSEKEVTKPLCSSSAVQCAQGTSASSRGERFCAEGDKEAFKTLPSLHPSFLVQD